MKYEIITKSDTNFFPGLRALIGSLTINAPDIKRTVIDCGLTEDEKNYCMSRGCLIQSGKTNDFKIQDCMQHYYTSSIYGFITAELPRDTVVVHLDADAILLDNLDELVEEAFKHGFAAVSDFPSLCLEDQIRNADCIPFVQNIIPALNLSSITFNAGVFATNSNYFLDKIKPTIESLIPIHDKLWGNDQALLNLAAFHANPSTPFRDVGYKYNTRPSYSRSPDTPPLKFSIHNNKPIVSGIGGQAHVLHYVGKKKPWLENCDTTCPGFRVWKHYHSLG